MLREMASGIEPAIYYSSRLDKVGLVLVSGAFVVIGVLMVRDGEWPGYLVAGFFGLCCLVGLLALLPGAFRLRIDQRGLEMRALFRTTWVRWDDVEAFGVITHRVNGLRTHQMVGFLTRRPDGRGRGERLSRALTGFDGGLGDNYGWKVPELADHLNDCLARIRSR